MFLFKGEKRDWVLNLCAGGQEDSRERVLLPEQLGREGLVDGLLLALGASAPGAAVHDLGALHPVVPGPGQDVVGGALPVLHHPGHLEPEKGEMKK